MARLVFEFVDPERFLIGTVGVPGEREFYLQVKGEANGKRVMASFALEKAQAAALAERCREIVKEVARGSSAQIYRESADLAALETPIEAEFALGVISLSWIEVESRFLFEAQAISNSQTDEVFEELFSDDAADAPAILRVRIDAGNLLSFARRTELVVAAGRQPCVFCGGPINPGGHLCPRSNGYRRQIPQ